LMGHAKDMRLWDQCAALQTWKPGVTGFKASLRIGDQVKLHGLRDNS